MGYVREFQARLSEKSFPRFMELWEEYLTVDSTDVAELLAILRAAQQSDHKSAFGAIVETLLPMWRTIQDRKASYEVLRLILDLQTTQSDTLRQLATDAVKERYEEHSSFKEGLKLVGLRAGDFQGALKKFDLLAHLGKGRFVYHTAGWGTGEILDLSFVREQLTIEFEKVGGKKDLSFINAFKTLEPLSDESFLARRFANPDLLEKEAKQDPLAVIKLLLKELGPKSAQEIKDELIELVIPEKEWVKWWQGVRNRLKKDPIIEVPESAKERFSIRLKERSLGEIADEVLAQKGNLQAFIPLLYSFIRDYPEALRDEKMQREIEATLLEKMREPGIPPEADLQLALFLEQYLSRQVPGHTIQEGIARVRDPKQVVGAIEVLALKKRALQAVQLGRKEWKELFLELLIEPQATLIRDFLLKSLLADEEGKKLFLTALEKIFKRPDTHPDFFVWYFQKIAQGEEVPFGNREGGWKALETIFILLSSIENQVAYKELAKRIFNLLSGKRYEVVRQMIDSAPTDFLKEFILLASKCHTFSEQDVKVLRSLAAVVDPSLMQRVIRKDRLDPLILWVTPESLQRVQQRIKTIGTSETVENAREIEAARALGDLRENSEFKFAKEKRARLQEEMRRLSQEIQKARILSREDVETGEVGVGNVVTLQSGEGELSTYTLLGPWDAVAERGILSSQSPFAIAMMGKKLGESFSFKEEEYLVQEIRSFFDAS